MLLLLLLQVHGLTEDLIAYRRTLAAVHSGADLAAAIDGVLGYDAGECKGECRSSTSPRLLMRFCHCAMLSCMHSQSVWSLSAAAAVAHA